MTQDLNRSTPTFSLGLSKTTHRKLDSPTPDRKNPNFKHRSKTRNTSNNQLENPTKLLGQIIRNPENLFDSQDALNSHADLKTTVRSRHHFIQIRRNLPFQSRNFALSPNPQPILPNSATQLNFPESIANHFPIEPIKTTAPNVGKSRPQLVKSRPIFEKSKPKP